MRITFLPMQRSSGSTASNVPASPPTRIPRSPEIAAGLLFTTGASSMTLPVWATFCARPMDTAGAMVLMSMTTVPGASTGSSSSTTAVTCSLLGTMRMMCVDCRPTSAAEAAPFAPRATNLATAPGCVSYTTGWCPPAVMTRSHMDSPMMPSPIEPTFIIRYVCQSEAPTHPRLPSASQDGRTATGGPGPGVFGSHNQVAY